LAFGAVALNGVIGRRPPVSFLCILVQVDRWAGGLGWSSVFATSEFYRCCNRGEVTEGHRGSCSARV